VALPPTLGCGVRAASVFGDQRAESQPLFADRSSTRGRRTLKDTRSQGPQRSARRDGAAHDRHRPHQREVYTTGKYFSIFLILAFRRMSPSVAPHSASSSHLVKLGLRQDEGVAVVGRRATIEIALLGEDELRQAPVVELELDVVPLAVGLGLERGELPHVHEEGDRYYFTH